MPRIRKKTSKRTTTFQKSKIHKKAAETRKKNKRSANRDVTWKSKKDKDPGIPNSFPYKDRVLAELAEEKRITLEQKAARIAAFKAAAQNPHLDPEEEAETPGISSVGKSSVLTRPKGSLAALSGSSSLSTLQDDVVDGDIPDLVDTELPTLQAVLDRADVVCEVVDARDILGGRSRVIEDLVTEARGKIVLVANKIDLVPKEALQSWLKHIQIPVFLFKSTFTPALAPSVTSSKTLMTSPSTASSSSAASISPNSILGRKEFIQVARKWSTEKRATATDAKDSDLVIAFMGLPSVGKSSVVNSLLPISTPRQKVAPPVPTSNTAKHPQPTTLAPVELKLDLGEDGGVIRVIDTPGWEFIEDEPEDEDENEEEEEEEEEGKDGDKWDQLEDRIAGDLLRRNLGRIDKVKDVFPLVNYIVKRSNAQDLMLAYNVPFFENGDVEAFLLGLARAQGRVKKHGDLDVEAAARTVLRDWSLNLLPYYTTPPTTSTANAASMDVDESHGMNEVLATLRGRKEMRKESTKGVIRFKSGEVDEREVILDDDYTEMATGSDEEDNDEDVLEGEEEDEEDSEGDEDDEDDEDEEVLEDSGEYIIGSDEGEVLSLEDGSEPSSPSGDNSDEEEEEEEEVIPAPTVSRKNKRKADDSPAAPAKRSKKVNFPKQLEAPRSIDKGIIDDEIVGILKRTKNSANAKKEKTKSVTPKIVKEKTIKKKSGGVGVGLPGVVGKEEGAYDFSKHFF